MCFEVSCEVTREVVFIGIILFIFGVIPGMVWILATQPPPQASVTPHPPVIVKDFGTIQMSAGGVDSLSVTPNNQPFVLRFTPTQQASVTFVNNRSTNNLSKFPQNQPGFLTTQVLYIPVFTGPSITVNGTASVQVGIFPAVPAGTFTYAVAWQNSPTFNIIQSTTAASSTTVDLLLTFTITFTPADVAPSAGAILFSSIVLVPPTFTAPVFVTLTALAMTLTEV
jgi:hypothetical protein